MSGIISYDAVNGWCYIMVPGTFILFDDHVRQRGLQYYQYNTAAVQLLILVLPCETRYWRCLTYVTDCATHDNFHLMIAMYNPTRSSSTYPRNLNNTTIVLPKREAAGTVHHVHSHHLHSPLGLVLSGAACCWHDNLVSALMVTILLQSVYRRRTKTQKQSSRQP